MDALPPGSTQQRRGGGKCRQALLPRPSGGHGARGSHAGGGALPPAVSALLYMLLGGALVFLLLGNGFRGEQAPLAGVVHLATLPSAAPVAPAPPAPGFFTVSVAPAQTQLCDDSCFKANDGVCDDGRFLPNMSRSLPSRILCDLGTDCSDCKPWHGVRNTSTWSEPVGPVEYLRRAGLVMLVKRSALEPRFHFAYTHPAHDTDLSKHFDALGTVEPRLAHISYHTLHAPCQRGSAAADGAAGLGPGLDAAPSGGGGGNASGGGGGAPEGLMIDGGAFFGYHSLLAATLGCRVIAFEPVSAFRAFLQYNVARNKLQHKIEVRGAALTAPQPTPGGTPAGAATEQHQQAARNVTVVAPQRGIWGTASIDGVNIDTAVDNQGAYHKVSVPAETLDAVVLPLLSGAGRRHSRVALLKLDVEGWEPDAIAGAEQLLRKQLIDNVLLEYSPHVVEKHNITLLPKYPRMLQRLLGAGFQLGHVAKLHYENRVLASYSEPLEQLQSITETNLKFDAFDCMQMTEVGMTWLHDPCPEMASYHLIGDGVPERLHPKSFRSAFEVNTNVWATRAPRHQAYVRGPAVGAFPAERKLTDSWFVPDWSDVGLGGRSCRHLREVAAAEGMGHAARAALLVRHRCRCEVAGRTTCADEERIADACAQAGRTPFRDEPDFVPQRRR